MKVDIASLRKKILIKYPFFSNIVLNLKFIEDSSVETVQTNAKVILYNPNFLKDLSLEQQLFIFCHEICHIAFNHHKRYKGKDINVWNLATDAVINAFLEKDGLVLDQSAIMYENAINYDAESLYEIMMKKKKERENNKKNKSSLNDGELNASSSSNTSSSSKNSSDEESNEFEHKKNNWEDLLDSNEDKGHVSHKNWYEDDLDEINELNDGGSSSIDKSQSEELLMNEKDIFAKNLEEKKRMLDSLKQSITTDAIRRIGNGGIGVSRAVVDWRLLFREATTYELDWSYENAYIENGVVNPVLEQHPISTTEILLDTSGSINEELLRSFLRECKNILKVSKLRVGCFDTNFYGFYDINSPSDIDNMKFNGGGNTDFNVAVRAFGNRVDNKIIFTDGEAEMPNISVNAVWVVFGNKQIHPRGGRVIRISDEQLKRLSLFVEDDVSIGRSR